MPASAGSRTKTALPAFAAVDDVAELSSYRCYRFTFFVSAPFVHVSLSLSQLCPANKMMTEGGCRADEKGLVRGNC